MISRVVLYISGRISLLLITALLFSIKSTGKSKKDCSSTESVVCNFEVTDRNWKSLHAF